ncbi:Crp/Fnr family transcriptional regulator [Paludibacterium sp.]|uniref:Crp/Fnr family transcriptional regulator n=1 Tax=Paludibacterium sp. TaxID=1917523 RepID=UPI0025DDFDDF|nr:Crp/Fnr family transcriptional regulator [Paludibacterium sp.]MBV8648168.1 Crp/Fnr family transcriptional regulator [Paludibacterium sp.]
MNHGEITTFLSAYPKLCAQFSGTTLHDLLTLSSVERIKSKEYVFCIDESSDNLFLIVSGIISVVISDKKSRVIEILEPGDFIGEAALLLDRIYQHDARALCDSTLLCIPKDMLNNIHGMHAELSLMLARNLAKRWFALTENINLTSHADALRRVGNYLLHLNYKDGCARFPCDKAVIASLLNIEPETLSRTLQVLRSQGTIHVSGRNITLLDALSLQQIARGTEADEVPATAS